MLILTRRVGETLMVGDDVTVTVLGVKGNQVRIGVNAPKEVAVHREEIYQRIQHEKKQRHRRECLIFGLYFSRKLVSCAAKSLSNDRKIRVPERWVSG